MSVSEHRERYGQRGYYSLADLPQRGSLADHAFGSGWWELDQIFKFYHGQFVVVTGMAGHGKSTFMLNVIAKMAREKGIKSFLYAPENEVYLFEKLKGIYGNDELYPHFCEDQCFVQSATPEGYNDPVQTLFWVLEQARIAVERDKVELIMIDPWNELERALEKGQLLTDYIGECLIMLKQFCRCFNVSIVMIAHPTKAVTANGGRVPTLADIEGSMNWYNKCDNGLIVTRDEERKNVCKVISAKVREIGAGRLGTCYFTVNPDTGVFTPDKGGVDVQ